MFLSGRKVNFCAIVLLFNSKKYLYPKTMSFWVYCMVLNCNDCTSCNLDEYFGSFTSAEECSKACLMRDNCESADFNSINSHCYLNSDTAICNGTSAAGYEHYEKRNCDGNFLIKFFMFFTVTRILFKFVG